MTLDAPTLFSSLLLANLAGAVLLGVVALLERKSGPDLFRTAGFWSASMVPLAGGLLLAAIYGPFGTFETSFLAWSLIFVALALRIEAISRFFGYRSVRWASVALPVLWLLSGLVPQDMLEPASSGLVATLAALGLLLLLAGMCWKNTDPALGSAKVMGCSILLEIAAIALALLSPVARVLPFTEELAFSEAPLLAVLSANLAFVSGSIAIVAMGLERRYRAAQAALHIDSLTGLPDRQGFLDLCKKQIKASAISKPKFSLIALEMDILDKVEKRYGRPLADQLMKLLGKLCVRSAGGEAVTGRLEGPVFAIFMTGLTQESAALLASRIGRQMNREILKVTSGKLKIGIRAGIFSGTPSTSMSQAADLAQGCLIDARLNRSREIILWDDTRSGQAKRSTYRPDQSKSQQKAA